MPTQRRMRKARSLWQCGIDAGCLNEPGASADAAAAMSARPERPEVISLLRRPGDYGGVAAPDPIPNSAVKRPSADGTSSQDAGE